MKNDKTNEKTIEQMMAELNERIAWFQSEEFNLDEAKQRFIEGPPSIKATFRLLRAAYKAAVIPQRDRKSVV